MPTVEERVETLESLLGQFIVHTDIALRRLERQMEEFRREAEKDRQAIREELRTYKEEAEKDRQAIREELRTYKEGSERQIQAMRHEMKEMNKRWGEIANKMGTLVEDIVVPNIKAVAREFFGCEDIEFFGIRIEKRHPETGQKREFDVIAVCSERVILNETKSTPRQNYIDDFVEFVKEGRFFEYFPEYRGRELVPVFASLYMSEEVVRQLTKNKIYAMAMREGTMEILNPGLKAQAKSSRKTRMKKS